MSFGGMLKEEERTREDVGKQSSFQSLRTIIKKALSPNQEERKRGERRKKG